MLTKLSRLKYSTHFGYKDMHLHAMYLCSISNFGMSKMFVKNKGFVPVSKYNGTEWHPKRQAQYTKNVLKSL